MSTDARTPAMLPGSTVSVSTHLRAGTGAYRTSILASAKPTGTPATGRTAFSVSMSYDGRGGPDAVEAEAVRLWNQRFA